MKRCAAFILLAVLLTTFAAGCRSKGSDSNSQSPSSSTAATYATIPETQQTERNDPTINSGNGPIEEETAQNYAHKDSLQPKIR